MKMNIASSPAETARMLIAYILRKMEEEPEKVFHIAFSGGSTPALLFSLWGDEFAHATPWKRMKIWWVDERCVHPEDPESNYGLMKRKLLDKVPVPDRNIFRIRGEGYPRQEAMRYSALVNRYVPLRGGLPSFDIVLLGIGSDGHTSSIFPGQEHLLHSPRVYEVSVHPTSKQKRIALTGQPIINAIRVVFLVTGKEKADAIQKVCTQDNATPSAFIAHRARHVEFFMDEDAASMLHSEE